MNVTELQPGDRFKRFANEEWLTFASKECRGVNKLGVVFWMVQLDPGGGVTVCSIDELFTPEVADDPGLL